MRFHVHFGPFFASNMQKTVNFEQSGPKAGFGRPGPDGPRPSPENPGPARDGPGFFRGALTCMFFSFNVFQKNNGGSKTQFVLHGAFGARLSVPQVGTCFCIIIFPKQMFFLHKNNMFFLQIQPWRGPVLLLMLDRTPNGQQLPLPLVRFALLLSARNVKAKY